MRRAIWHLAAGVAVAAAAVLLAPAGAGAIPAGAPRIGMVCTPGSLAGSTRTFHLVANSGSIETPDGNGIFVWSYANADAPDNGHFQSPGPVLCANEGETVVVTLANTLPEPASIVFPGQDRQVSASGGAPGLFTREAAPGGSVTYSFPAAAPGTYLYESGSDVSKQLEMGLYGALVIRPALGAGYAYGSAGTRFAPAHEYLLLLSELDPELHHAVETGAAYDVNAKVDRYFAINGREFPDTIQDNGSDLLPNQPYGSLVRVQPNSATDDLPSLIRMINVGSLNHPFHPHGNHTTQIAQDGRLLVSPAGAAAGTEHFGETVASGQTSDYLLRWDDADNWSPAAKPLPVSPPNYRNVFFKDANTWYGGSPYLAYKGTLPAGTTSQNICGEWYFPLHSHALNEFSNYDQGFGGMGTLLRVDPPGGCFAAPATATILDGVLKAGSVASLAGDDDGYYQVSPKTTGTDWYAGFTGIPAGGQNVKVTYKGRNCAVASAAACAALTASPQQTVKICNWTLGGPAGCATATSAGWVTLPAAPSQPRSAGSPDVSTTWTVPGPAKAYVGTGAVSGQVRVLVHTEQTGPAPGTFATWGNLMALTFDAP